MPNALLLTFLFASQLLASTPVEVDSFGTIFRSLGVPGITAFILWKLLARSDKRYEVLLVQHQQMHEKMLQVIQESAERSGEVVSVLRNLEVVTNTRRSYNQDPAGRD